MGGDPNYLLTGMILQVLVKLDPFWPAKKQGEQKEPDSISFGSVVSAMAKAAMNQQALKIMDDMKVRDLQVATW